MEKRIVLIGAGSAMFGLGALGDIFKCKALQGSTVVLHDINPDALQHVESVTRDFVASKSLPYHIEATVSRKEALQGADFCIISIEVGDRYRLWEQDWHLAQQVGIPQVYGENGGPGGIFHSLRIIPPVLEICDDVNAICPEAWVINLSNPMSIICLAISKKYPDMKLVGVCHEVASIIEHIPRLLEEDIADLELRAGGLNHFSVLVDARHRKTGKDLYPIIRERVPQYYAGTPERNLVREIIRLYGCVPNTTDSHFGEYIQWAQEVVDHKGILDFYNGYMADCTKPINEMRRLETGTLPKEYWRVVPIMEGIVNDTGHNEMAVNIRNNGLIECLPDHIVVEVPATVDANGLHGVRLDNMPKGFAALMRNRVAVLDMTSDAALYKSKEMVLHALLCEPVVNSAYAAEKLLDMMLDYQSPYLGYLQ